MKLPFNDLQRTHRAHAEALEAAVLETMRSGWWLNGARAEGFAKSFAAFVGVRHAIGVGNGTDALEIALRALLDERCEGRREAVTVPNAGGYSAIAMHAIGLRPVYADIVEETQLASIPSILSALNERTGIVVATHLYGGVLDVPALREAMDARGFAHVPILEDCAQSHGAALAGRQTGSLGAIATFSFYPSKNLGAFGDGGAIVTDDEGLAAACASLRQYGWSRKYDIARPGGRNSRLDEVQAAILQTLLPHLPAANARRAAILERYERAAPAGLRMVRSPLGTVAHLAVALCEDRDGLKAHLAARGVPTDIHYPILDCDQAGWAGGPARLAPGGIPVARASVPRLLTLPCFPAMTDAEVDTVCEALAGWSA